MEKVEIVTALVVELILHYSTKDAVVDVLDEDNLNIVVVNVYHVNHKIDHKLDYYKMAMVNRVNYAIMKKH